MWGYTLLQAGLAVATVVAAALVWAAGLLWYTQQPREHPDFLGERLPGQLLQGVGATLPVLGSAALARIPAGGAYATASAVVSSARQLGAVLLDPREADEPAAAPAADPYAWRALARSRPRNHHAAITPPGTLR